MSDATPSSISELKLATEPGGTWKPVLTLLVLSPAIGELLSGSSPPLQFFNPISFLLLVGLYGCGGLLVRETVSKYKLNSIALLLLGAAYAIVEEGLTCKSFFNPHWTDTGFLSVYGRAWGVNWVWTFGLTTYHMVVSITVPIFLTEALFASHAAETWLRRRGWIIAGTSLSLVTLLGFWGFDNRQFHLIEIKDSLGLALRWNDPKDPLDRFVASQLTPKNRDVIAKAAASHADSPDLRHAIQDELNRLLARPDLYSPERFARVPLDNALKAQTTKPPKGDKLITFNRALLEAAFPTALATRRVYPYHPEWWWTLASLAAIVCLVHLALRQRQSTAQNRPIRRPWLNGLGFTAAFVVIGFVLPGLVEHGAKIPACFDCLFWVVIAVLIARVFGPMDSASDRIWRRGIWALGVITPWVLFALVLGVFVGMMGAKSFSGMPFVSLAFGFGVLSLGLRWKRRLDPPRATKSAT